MVHNTILFFILWMDWVDMYLGQKTINVLCVLNRAGKKIMMKKQFIDLNQFFFLFKLIFYI